MHLCLRTHFRHIHSSFKKCDPRMMLHGYNNASKASIYSRAPILMQI